MQQTSFNKVVPHQTDLGIKIGEGCRVCIGTVLEIMA